VGTQEGRFELLAGLTARLASTAKLDEIVDTVLVEIQHLGFAAVWMAVLDESTGHLLTLKEVIDGVDTTHEMPRIFMLDVRQPIGHGFRDRRMINITDPDSLFIIEDDSVPVPPGRLALPRVIYEHLRGHPFACGPLLGSRGQPVGALGLSSYQGRQPIPDVVLEEGLLHAFMDHLGIAMERANHITRLERLNTELLEAHAAIANSARIKAVGELAAAVAHDLNNLSGIAVLAAGAGRQSPEAAFEMLPRIERANQTIGELVDRLQRVARDAHPSTKHHDEASLKLIVEDTLAMLSPLLRERSIAVELDLQPTRTARADPSFVRQLLLNLILNAQDALDTVTTRERRLRIAVRDDGDTVRLEISDNGPGIANEVLPRLFEPFVTTKQGSHAGIGLAAAAGSLKHFGGNITGRNRTSGGAVFDVTFQTIASTDTEPVRPVAPPAAVGSRRGSILAIDDDADILFVVRAYLESVGYDVLTTMDADEALRLVPQRAFDLVLCDVGMPKRNGLDVCTLMRESGYRGKIVLMTGWDAGRVQVDRRSQSCDEVLKKPFLGSELVQLIDTILVPPT
jgi:signal transduction histidine kinase/CheY-like chemotaxis protein